MLRTLAILPCLLAGALSAPKPIILYEFNGTSNQVLDTSGVQPPANLSIRRVTQRVYRGYCAQNDVSGVAVARVIAKKEALLTEIEQTPLPERKRAHVERFVDGFFQVVEDPVRVERRLVGRCR